MVIDGFTFGPDLVEIDGSAEPPRFRYRYAPSDETAMLKPTRNPEVVLQPREAFTGFGSFVINAHHEVSQMTDMFYPSNRGFAVSTEGMTLWDSFDKIVKGAMSELYDTGKVKYEEAVLPFVVCPSERVTYEAFPESFKKFLTGKKLLPACAAEQLSISLPKISTDAIAEDLRCRQAFLAALTSFLGCETLACAARDDNEALGKALVCLAKVNLVTLHHIFQSFLKAKWALRKEALKGCDLLAPHCVALIKSSPFSENIFGEEEVGVARLESLRLNLPMADLLRLGKGSTKRKGISASARKNRNKKNRTAGPSTSTATPTSTQSQRGAPRGRGDRGRGRGSRARGRGASSGQSQTKAQPTGGKGF